MTKFWTVYCIGTNGGYKYKHSTEHAAITEAERLAKLHPGKDFVVLEATKLVHTPPSIVIETLQDELPF